MAATMRVPSTAACGEVPWQNAGVTRPRYRSTACHSGERKLLVCNRWIRRLGTGIVKVDQNLAGNLRRIDMADVLARNQAVIG